MNRWNIDSGDGCQSCGCHQVGSSSDSCDSVTGQCTCLTGVTGPECDSCGFNYYNLTITGCMGEYVTNLIKSYIVQSLFYKKGTILNIQDRIKIHQNYQKQSKLLQKWSPL